MDLEEILGQLGHALSLLTVCRCALGARTMADAIDEEALVQEIITHLIRIHGDLDHYSLTAASTVPTKAAP